MGRRPSRTSAAWGGPVTSDDRDVFDADELPLPLDPPGYRYVFSYDLTSVSDDVILNAIRGDG